MGRLRGTTNELVNSIEGSMDPIRTAAGAQRSKRTLRTLVRVAGFAALIAAVAPTSTPAQTAAQRAALARMGRAHPQNAQPNGLEATSVPLLTPYGLAFDSTGNLYIADAGDNLIREISVTGVISTAAGSGTEGYSGDGGAATSAELDTPSGVAVDASGNLYIADTLNNCIRKVSGGTIATIAGTGVAGFSGDAGPAAAAELDQPAAVAVDAAGHVYIADTNNNRIREIVGTTINTVAGNGQQTYSGDDVQATAAGLNSPSGVAVDAAFNIYIGDTENQRVRMVAYATGIITTIAGTGVQGFTGDGPALSTALANPSGVYVNASGTVYVADSDNDRIRTISGGNVTTIAGDGVEGFSGDGSASTGATLDTPRAVTSLGTVVFFSDTLNNRVREVTGGNIDTAAGNAAPAAESLVIGSALSAVYGTGSLTATFSNGGAAGTGLVTFYDGEGANQVIIGQALLANNAATISTAALAAGTHSIVAAYAGDAKNAPITSGVYVFVVTAPDFSISASPATQSIVPSQSVNYTISVTPVNSTFAYPVTFSASGLPNGVIATFSPASIATGAGPSTTTLTLSANGVARLRHNTEPFAGWPSSTALALFLLPLAFGKRGRKAAAKLSRAGWLLIVLLALAAAAGTITGCGGDGGFFAHPIQSYTVTVTAVSGPNTHTANVTLTVQ